MLKVRYLIIVLCLVTMPWLTARAAAMPQSGTSAPAFTLPDQAGKNISLRQFRDHWVVLYFYPKDFTKGCSLEAHNFQSDIKKYIAKNAVIVGVSVDTVDSHKSFCTKEGLNFVLLSDADHKVSNTYDSTMSLLGFTLSARNTFLIDPQGMIRKVYTKVNPSLHSDEVLADLDRLEMSGGK